MHMRTASSSRASGGSIIGRSSRASLGLREGALDRAINDPSYFPSLESLATAVVGDDLSSVFLPEELATFKGELLDLGEEMVKIRQGAAKTKEAANALKNSYATDSVAGIPTSEFLEDEIRTELQRQQTNDVGEGRMPDAQLRDILTEAEVSVIGSGGLQTVCPITRDTMEHPFHNKKCGHYYSKEGFEMLKTRLRCPICNKGFAVSDVKKDEEMAVRIKLYHQEQEAMATQRQTQIEAETTVID